MSRVTMKHFPIILVLLMAITGCKYLRHAQKIASEAADAKPVKTLQNGGFTLTGPPNLILHGRSSNIAAGTLSDLGSLGTKIKEIMILREKHAVFDENTNNISNDIFFAVDGLIPIGDFARLHSAITENGGEVRIPRKTELSFKDFPYDKPNPLILVVSVGDAAFAFADSIPSGDKIFSFTVLVDFVTDPIMLKVRRLQTNSIEISADDNYFINEKVNIMPDSDPEIIDLKQRAISASDLQTELSKIVSGETKLRIIASEKGSYAGLLKVFEAAEKLNVDFEVLVRKHDLKTRR